jgi:predicted transcriptional regulator
VTCFSEGREGVTDEERLGWPATSRTEENIVKVCQIVCEDRHLTVRSIAEQANIGRETVRKILTEDLDMRKVYKNGPKGALSVRELLASKRITVLEYPHYSPDLAPQ